MRIVVDATVLIAAHVTRAGVCAEIYDEILQHHELVLSSHIMDEAERNLRRKFLLPDDLIERTMITIAKAAQIVAAATVRRDDSSDPDDRPLLGTAVAAEAGMLVTARPALVDQGSFDRTEIVRPGEFFRRATGRAGDGRR